MENVPAGAGVEKKLCTIYKVDTKDSGRYILLLMMKEIVSLENIYYKSYKVRVGVTAQEKLAPVGSKTCNVAQCVSTAAESHAQTQVKEESNE